MVPITYNYAHKVNYEYLNFKRTDERTSEQTSEQTNERTNEPNKRHK